ncbi:uncharacterized protein PAC_18070 [Phialocephala subalpina]|uniref:BZIP domain-containing protein n=1 Tax=Phialocephala subalpina TaxID=576137 RepID=A0A1L7XT23_9HELO|nr:uncharacterized protein PAC_18070 [Phialocephala subalpina]
MPRSRQKRIRSAEPDPAQEFENWEELNETTKRRLRNRLSQRHFRERKSMYIKELEERTKTTAQSESERNQTLIREAAELRRAALKARSQILKISVALNCIGAEVGRILNVQGAEESEPDEEMDNEDGSDSRGRGRDMRSKRHRPPPKEQTRPSSSNSMKGPHEVESAPFSPSKSQPRVSVAATTPPESIETLVSDIASEEAEQTIPEEFYEEPIDLADPNNIALENFIAELFENSESRRAVPINEPPSEIDSCPMNDQPPQHDALGSVHQNTIGMNAEHAGTYMPYTMVPSQTRLVLPHGLFPNSPAINHLSPNSGQSSMFSEHIEALELQARCKLDVAPDGISRQIAYQHCTAIMSLFICNAWPRTHSVWFKSEVPEIIGPILLWRIHPTTETYKNLLPDYKPTQVQLTVPHSAIIDWIPYADLRDRVIMYYNHSVVLDRLMCDMMNSYVIEVNDLSRILPQAPPGRAYFGIWNIYRAIDAASLSLMKSGCAFQAESSFLETGPDFIETQVGEAGQSFDDTTNAFQDLLFSSIPPHSASNDRITHQNSHHHDRSDSFSLLEVLTTPALVLKLSHDIRLYAAKSWRFDPGLFEKWPELKFEGYEAIVAKGRSYRIPTAPPDAPIRMTEATKAVYQEALQNLA